MRTVFTIIVLACGVVSFTAKGGNDTYLLFPPEFRVVEVTRLGVLPQLAAGSLVEEYAKTRFEDAFTSAYGATLLALNDADGMDDAKTAQGLALLKQVTQVVRQHLDPEDQHSFFDGRMPELVIGPAFSTASVDGRRIEFGLAYSVVQYRFDGVRTRRLFGGDESKGFLVSACVVRLVTGAIDHCRVYSAPGDYLLHPAGYFEGPSFSEYVSEMLNEPAFLVYQAAGQ